jgi:hypothetical protein
MVSEFSMKPAEMNTANHFFDNVEKLQPASNKIVLIAADWGPNTKAENEPQTLVAIEHLMRKRIAFALISNLPFSVPFLEELPQRVASQLERENPGQRWVYGKDWVNLGYRPGSYIMIQGLAKASNLLEVIKTDASGTPIEDIPLMKNIRTIRDISMLMEFTGSVGIFNYWLQFFQADGYTPPYVHGCTSVTIPEAYIYFISGQIVGLYEGVAGAAWYDELLSRKYQGRKPGPALQRMTALSFAHLIIIALIILGNIGTAVRFFLGTEDAE